MNADAALASKTENEENFPVASRLIAPRFRATIIAFYRFARKADDVADHPDLAPQAKLDKLAALDESLSGQTVAVVSVYERDRLLMEYLEGLGVRPGATVRVESRNYDETLTLRVDGKSVPLGQAAAQKVWVKAGVN